VELVFACEEALELLSMNYEMPDHPYIEVHTRKQESATEPPKLPGVCFITDMKSIDGGVIKTARIIAPTSQNQKVIENDLAAFVPLNLHIAP
jgi:sulfhydrogenase subunit alpha